MALPMLKEMLNTNELEDRRRLPRQKLSGLLPGKMMMANQDKTLTIRPIDVSESGIGIMTAEWLREGDKLVMKVGRDHIKFKVIWIRRDFGKQDFYRAGLKMTSKKFNLIDVFRATGCME